MRISSRGLKLIEKREGVVLHVYKDTKGLPTAGVGHLLTASERAQYPVGTKITQAQSDAWLSVDLKESEDAVNSLGVDLTQNQYDALVSLTFNIGVGGFRKSTVARRLKAGNVQGAAEAILLWNKPPEIQGRRRGEYNQFKTPYIGSTGSAAAPVVTPSVQGESITSDGQENQTNPPDQPPLNTTNGSTVKAEITPEGGVKVESTTEPPQPKERIAVVGATKQKWTSRVTTKITGAVSGNLLFQWLWAQMERIGNLPVPDLVWVIVSLTIAIGSLLWLAYEILQTWQYNKRQDKLDELLVTQNSTDNNLAQLIPADEVEIYRARGFKIITRGEPITPAQK